MPDEQAAAQVDTPTQSTSRTSVAVAGRSVDVLALPRCVASPGPPVTFASRPGAASAALGAEMVAPRPQVRTNADTARIKGAARRSAMTLRVTLDPVDVDEGALGIGM